MPVRFGRQFLILATDGVWDVTEIGQAVQIVQVRVAAVIARVTWGASDARMKRLQRLIACWVPVPVFPLRF